MKDRSYHTPKKKYGKDGFYYIQIRGGHITKESWIPATQHVLEYLKKEDSKEVSATQIEMIKWNTPAE